MLFLYRLISRSLQSCCGRTLSSRAFASGRCTSVSASPAVLDEKRGRYQLSFFCSTKKADSIEGISQPSTDAGAAEEASRTRATTAHLPVGGARRDSNARSRGSRGRVFAAGERGNRQRPALGAALVAWPRPSDESNPPSVQNLSV